MGQLLEHTELRVTDITLRDSALTRAELEQAIELRASLLSETANARCAFVPDFALADNKLAGLGVSYLCPTPSSGSEIGGGPIDELPEDDTRPAPAERVPATRGAAERRPPRERSAPDDGR